MSIVMSNVTSNQHSNNGKAEQQIRDLVNQYVSAVRKKDLNRVAALYTDDVLAFDAIMALQFKGKAAYMAHWQTCMEFAKGDTLYEVHQLQVTANEQLAFKTKEQLAGFYLIEAHDLNEAIQLASGIPAARVGSVEVRPVRQLEV